MFQKISPSPLKVPICAAPKVPELCPEVEGNPDPWGKTVPCNIATELLLLWLRIKVKNMQLLNLLKYILRMLVYPGTHATGIEFNREYKWGGGGGWGDNNNNNVWSQTNFWITNVGTTNVGDQLVQAEYALLRRFFRGGGQKSVVRSF